VFSVVNPLGNLGKQEIELFPHSSILSESGSFGNDVNGLLLHSKIFKVFGRAGRLAIEL
jgi:hypothetical protein